MGGAAAVVAAVGAAAAGLGEVIAGHYGIYVFI